MEYMLTLISNWFGDENGQIPGGVIGLIVLILIGICAVIFIVRAVDVKGD